MIFTLCWEDKEFSIDIKVNREQKVSETLLILADGGILPMDFEIEKMRLFSKRKGEYIDINLSYEQGDIFNGDILYIR